MISRLRTLAHSARTHAGFRRYAANTSWMFAEQMLRMVAGLLVGIWVARYLGPEQFGLFNYAVAFTALFGSIAKLGLDSIVVRDLVRNPEQRDIYLGTAFWLKLVGAALMLCTMAVAMHFTGSDTTAKLYIFIIASGSVFQAFEVVDFYFQSKVLSKFVSICKITQLFISSSLKLYLIYVGSGLFPFIVVSLVDQIILAIALYFSYKYQRVGVFFFSFDWWIAKKLLNDSWPLIFMSAAITIYMRIDQIMIQEMLGAERLGIYTAAVRLSEVWYFIPMIVASSILPSIISAKKNNFSIYKNRLQNISTIITWVAIFIAVLITAIATPLVDFLYGAQYSEAGILLSIQIWSGVFVFLGVVSGMFFTVENYNKKSLYRTVLGGVVNICLNLLLIPRFGILGSAVATLISQFCALFILDFFDKNARIILIIKINALFPLYLFFGKRLF